jgi:hypothetical protein
VRKRFFSLGTIWLLTAAVFPLASRADDQIGKPAQSLPTPSSAAKSLSPLKLPESDFSLGLQTERLRGSDRPQLPTGLPLAKREPAVPFVGFTVSKPLGPTQ